MTKRFKYKIVFQDIQPKIKKHHIYSQQCYLGVSLNNAFFSGKHLGLLFRWLSKRFNNTQVIIGDHLNRYNELIFSTAVNMDQAINQSMAKGALIAKNVAKELDNYNISNIKTCHSFEFYSLTDFKFYYQKIKQEYTNNHAARISINKSARDYIFRNFPNENNNKILEEKLKLYRLYILEELAIFCCLIMEGYKVQAYPGTQLDILKKTCNNEIIMDDIPLNKGIYIDLSVKKK